MNVGVPISAPGDLVVVVFDGVADLLVYGIRYVEKVAS